MNMFRGKLLPWVKFDDVYNFSNNIESAVYAFGLFDVVPKPTQWPFFTEEVFYIGMSGGLETNYTVDLKDSNTNRHYKQTVLHKRLKHHGSVTLKNKFVLDGVDSGKIVCVTLIVPGNDVSKSICRNWLSMVESEQLLCYNEIYGKLPLLNKAESSSVSINRIDEESFSQSQVQRLKSIDIERFIENESV